MRRTLIGLAGATLLAWATATVGCSSTGAGGSSGGSSGTAGNGGSGGGSSAATSGSGGSSSTGGNGGSGGSPGAGTGTGGDSVTSLSGSKPLGTLTPSEATQLCDDTYAYFGRAVSQATLCKAAGLTFAVSSSAPTDAQLQQNCASEETACLQADPASASCSDITSTCSVTVAEYSACIAEQAATFTAGAEPLAGCATVTKNDLPAIWDFATRDLPASCASIESACAGLNVPTPHAGTTNPGGSTGGSGGTGGTAGTGGSAGAGGGTTGTGGSGGSMGGSGGTTAAGGSGGTTAAGGAGGSAGGSGGSAGSAGGSGGTAAGGAGGSSSASTLPGDVAKAAGTPFVAAHAMTRALFASYDGPLFRALRVSDQQEKDIGVVAAGGLVDIASLNSFCAGTSCKVTTLYDQSGNGNDMWRADDPNTNQPGTNKPCDLMDIDYWQMSDGTKMPIAVETGAMWKSTAQCLRNRDKTKNMPTGAKPQTEYAIFHAKYLNNNCCFNYGNTGNAIHYSGPGTLSALNFSKITFWSKGTGDGPWPMVDFETGVYAGNTAKCGSGVPTTVDCTATGENANPSVPYDIVTTLFKHNGVDHWELKTGNAQAGMLSVNVNLSALPKGYSPLKQEGGLGLGEGGAGDANGTGGFSEGGVIAGETSDATDNAIQASIVSVYGK